MLHARCRCFIGSIVRVSLFSILPSQVCPAFAHSARPHVSIHHCTSTLAPAAGSEPLPSVFSRSSSPFSIAVSSSASCSSAHPSTASPPSPSPSSSSSSSRSSSIAARIASNITRGSRTWRTWSPLRMATTTNSSDSPSSSSSSSSLPSAAPVPLVSLAGRALGRLAPPSHLASLCAAPPGSITPSVWMSASSASSNGGSARHRTSNLAQGRMPNGVIWTPPERMPPASAAAGVSG
mmetsp:Transcript_53039/g.137194  ORF Transcript_53039/g.137194 Transcript_53039/m.137194 type:complete len:236 (+) Transcript_53039:230-937(+)